MPVITVKNNTAKPVYAFQYVQARYKVVDFLIDAAELVAGMEELKLAVLEVEELPAEIRIIEDVFKYIKVIFKIRKKSIKVKKDAESLATIVYKIFTKKTIIIPPGKSVNILDEKALEFFVTAEGIASLFYANVITIGLLSDEGNLSLQYQSDVNTTWEVSQGGVENKEHSIMYRWHGQGEHQSTRQYWRPALAVFNEQLILVGRGEDSSVWWSSFNGHSWSFRTHIHGIRTKKGVSITALKGYLYAAWIDLSGSDNPQISKFDGAGWTYLGALGYSGSSDTPFIFTTLDILNLLWKGYGDDVKIYHSSSKDGSNWEKQFLEKGYETSNSPTAAFVENFSNYFVQAWKGFGDDTRIHCSVAYQTANSQPIQQIIPGSGTSTSPALANVHTENKIYCAWKEPGTNHTISYCVASTPPRGGLGTWSSPPSQVPGAKTNDGPALAIFKNKLYLVWKDTKLSHTVNWSRYADGVWTTPKSTG